MLGNNCSKTEDTNSILPSSLSLLNSTSFNSPDEGLRVRHVGSKDSIYLMIERWAWRRPPKLSLLGGIFWGAGRHGKAPWRSKGPHPIKPQWILLASAVLAVLLIGIEPVYGSVVPYIHQATIMSNLRVRASYK